MKIAICFFVVLISSNAFALELYLSGCRDPLAARTVDFAGHKIGVAPDQVVLRGELKDNWDVGLAEMTLWAVRDQFLLEKIVGAEPSALIALRTGDHVFMQGPDGKLIEGFYKQILDHDHQLVAHSVDHSINRPQLYRNPDFKDVLLSEKEFAPMFYNGTHVLVLQTPEAYNQYHFRMLLPAYQKYLEQQRNLARFIEVNSSVSLELAHFEKAIWGKIETEIRDGALNLRVKTTEGRLIDVAFKDRLIVLDGEKAVIFDQDLSLNNRLPVGQAALQTEARLKKAERVVLIQRQ